MQGWGKTLRHCIFLLVLASRAVYAVQPDPVEFAWAVEQNNLKKVRAWLEEGLDPEYQGKEIGTGLMIAAWYGHIPMMALFVEHGANPRRANRLGEQPIQLAAWNNHVEAVKWLLAHGVSLNRDGNYWSALHYAVFNGHSALAKYLIEQGADVNARSPNRSTPLMMAVREGREDLAKALVESGADIKARNDWGDDALAFAVRYDQYKIGKMIATPEEFAIAVKAPKENFGEPARSAALPDEVEGLLRRIREAEATGQPTEVLRTELMAAIKKIRPATTIVSNRRPMPLPYQPSAILITAKRNQPGAERAQVVAGPQSKALPSPMASGKSRPTFDQLAELMRQISLAEAQGQPTDDLRKQLTEMAEKMKR